MTLESFLMGYAAFIGLYLMCGGVFLQAHDWWLRRWR